MADDQRSPSQPSAAIATGFDAAFADIRQDIRELREDSREDLGALRADMTVQIAALREEMHGFIGQHAEEHREAAETRRRDHEKYDAFLRRFEIDEAIRDGMLGYVRLVFEWIGRYGTKAIGVILAIAALLGVATGSVQISAGVK